MGSHISPHIFREYDIRGIVGRDLTAEAVRTLGLAIGTYFQQHRKRSVAVGYDARDSSVTFLAELVAGLTQTGTDVLEIGLVPTPVLYWATFNRPIDGGIMITGSHNPADHNGFKIVLGTDALYGQQIAEIRSIAERGEFTVGTGGRDSGDILEEYRRDLASRIDLGPRKIRLAIDCGNGVGGLTAIPLYRSLGIELVELYSEPDSHFPHHHPDPTVEDNLRDLQREVIERRADLGIAFDGDGDRIGVVDETGRIIWGDELMIPIARSILRKNLGATIIAEVKCSQTLFDDIEDHGGRALMWKAGHSLIKAKMKETGALFAGEMSGHIFFADRSYGFDDATYAGARLLELLSHIDGPFSSLFAGIPRLHSTPEIRTACPEEQKFEVVRRVAEYFSRDHDVSTIDGARIAFQHGWGLVRPSNTQALLVSRFEADSSEHLEEIRSAVEEKIEAFLKENAGCVR